MADLPPGDYRVSAILPDFETVDLSVAVGADSAATVPVVMQTARLLETVSVVAEEPRIFARNISRRTDDDAAVEHHRRHVSGGQHPDNLPGVSVQEGDA